MKKRIFSLLLAIALLVGMVPTVSLADEATPTISKVSMTLTGILKVNFKVDAGGADMSAYALHATIGSDAEPTVITDCTQDSAGLYVYSVPLLAHRLPETLSIQLVCGESVVDSLSWTVSSYISALQEQEPNNSKLIALTNALINYGAYAAYYADPTGTAPAVEAVEAVTAEDLAAYAMQANTLNGLAAWAALYLDSACDLRIKFSASQYDLDAYTLTVDGAAVDSSALYEDSGRLVYELCELLPQHWSKLHSICVTGGEETLIDFDYSVLSYAYAQLGKTAEAATGLNGLLRAMYLYGAAAEAYCALSLSYRYGGASLIQYNTNLPSDTPLANFLATDNGCAVTQSGDQNVGWIGMDNADGTIVLSFHFNSAFEAGQRYTITAGSVFGFTDGSSYILDSDITLYWDGSSWSDTEPEPEPDYLSLAYRYGTDSLIQYNTDLPSTTPIADFTATENGCVINQSGDQNVGWIGMADASGTIVLTFNFNSAFTVGQRYTIAAGSVFGFTDGSSYILESDITLYWDGSNWVDAEPEAEEQYISFEYRYGAANLIQVNTDLPSTTPTANFLATDNGCVIDQSVNAYQQVGWIGMDNVDGTIVLTFNFGSSFEAGQNYILPAGSVFGFTDGSLYTLDATYTFTWDGSSWSMSAATPIENPIELSYRYGAANLIQYNTSLPSTTPIVNFTATDNGCVIDQSGDQQVGWVGMADADGTIVLTFNFNAAFSVGQRYTIAAGSVFGFTDGSSYTLPSDITLYWDGSNWVTALPEAETDVLDAENFTGGKEIITFADLPVDSTDTAQIAEYAALGFNTALMTEDYVGTQGPDENYTVTLETANTPESVLTLAYRWGTDSLLQVNTNLPSTTPIANFLATDNGCAITQNGDQQVGWIGMADADGTIVLTFNFNAAFAAGQSYTLAAGSVFGFTDGNLYTLDGDCTFTWDGSAWSMNCSALSLTLSSASASYIQLKTSIPTGLSYGDFLSDTTAHTLLLETTDGAQNVAWFSYSELSGAVYLTFNFSGYNKPGAQYILKAGTTLNAGDYAYTTGCDYILTVHNAYMTSLENLDAAGLNIWIRNHHNTADYFTENLMKALKLYESVIDGFYMVDEAFQTNALLLAAGQESTSSDFDSMVTARDWFNLYFADKYYHSNHAPITSYDHYTDVSGNTLSSMDADGYRAFLQAYKSAYNDSLTGASGSSISFDNYPFSHAQGTYSYGLLNLQSKFESGIASTYLLNGLIAAQVAAEDDFGMCIQTFEADDQTYDVSRDITSAAEVSLQLYTGLALGADVFEYFGYTSNGTFDCIVNQDGSHRIYDLVLEANKALCFADVVNTFTWNGIVTSTGSVNSHNTEAFDYVADMVLTNISNGALNSYNSTDDAIIGCFTGESLNGYMVVNFNDPIAVTSTNTVTLSFEDCTRARVYTCTDGALVSEVIDLTDGACTLTLAPGSGCFVIPA